MDKMTQVANEALKYVKEGDTIGLGSGRTSAEFIKAIGNSNLKAKVIGVATSVDSEKLARQVGIKTVDIDQVDWIDVCVDGADEVDNSLNVLKGGGGQLTREKKVRNKSRKYVIIVTDEKLVMKIPERRGIPIEILQFGYKTTIVELEEMGLKCDVREGFVTDNGNYICDCKPLEIQELGDLDKKIKLLTGVVETGLFLSPNKTILVSDGKEIKTL